jgi:flavodoxin
MAKNILVVFYSKTGNTKKVANDIADALGADIEEITDKKNRKGILGWLSGGRDAMEKRGTEIASLQKDPANYELVIIGSPVWAWTIVPAVRTYLETNKAKIEKYAFFTTSGSTPIEKTIPAIKTITEKDPIASSDFNEKELKDKNVYDKKLVDFVSSINAIK